LNHLKTFFPLWRRAIPQTPSSASRWRGLGTRANQLLRGGGGWGTKPSAYWLHYK
jgi:hypothetical protein